MISSHQRFPKSYRLRSKADFSAIRKGKRIRVGKLRITYRFNQLGYSRLGFAVSRKYGNAVERNRLKRQLRQVFRTSEHQSPGIDLFVVPATDAKQLRHAAEDFTEALRIIRSRQVS